MTLAHQSGQSSDFSYNGKNKTADGDGYKSWSDIYVLSVPKRSSNGLRLCALLFAFNSSNAASNSYRSHITIPLTFTPLGSSPSLTSSRNVDLAIDRYAAALSARIA